MSKKKKEDVVIESQPLTADPVILHLAALIYYNEHPGSQSFELLDMDIQEKWIARSLGVFSALDKMNKMVVKKVDVAEVERTQQEHIARLTYIIKDFVSGLKTTKPEFFPCEELAYKILGD